MNSTVHLDPAATASARRSLDALALLADRRGTAADFGLLAADQWLTDTAVVERLTRSRGEWRVELVFAYVHNPLRLLVRHITAHATAHRAAQQAHYMRRLAAKDQRGTLRVSVQQLTYCLT